MIKRSHQKLKTNSKKKKFSYIFLVFTTYILYTSNTSVTQECERAGVTILIWMESPIYKLARPYSLFRHKPNSHAAPNEY